MADPDARCTFCNTGFRESDFQRDRAVRILGWSYCAGCVKEAKGYCQFCGRGLRPDDLSEGRAITLSDRPYCEACMDRAVDEVHRAIREAKQPADRVSEPIRGTREGDTQRRLHTRFVPPESGELILKEPGVMGFLQTNRIRLWLDVSEGGCRAIVAGQYERAELFQLWIAHPDLPERLGVTAEVRHVKPARKYSGHQLVGFKFVDPSPELRVFIRCMLQESSACSEQPANVDGSASERS